MEKFISHTGIGAPLRVTDVDTDQIFPARFCEGTGKDGLGDALFADWRANPDFVLSRPEYRGASVIVAGEDFGTGSSREWAVWALQGYGIRVIIAPRFGDIFRGNSLQNGLLTIEQPQHVIDQIWRSLETHPHEEITVDLAQLEIRVDGATYEFVLDGHTRWRLLNGLDDIVLTLEHVDLINSYESHRRSTLPTAWRVPAPGADRG
ncbi:3-isopropylmalate dehydratase small subunit [Hoyosella subflava]|uniref:3-isopropylmalate dehydratase small subunit n=1 Tax=Hoyosella subflava (strain DSM 45089 / JCM 17490 / NBRC 109087 / DQS3-9A1) TaxID=443218 RepID=F6EGT0_HOYSD|nr:3-isopropylmalate dehydratase small subunit [Hoyosella subflava]AEF42318.1 3-isopropylmalate dehydratase small subunit [Hoyosella subflava DQS3-9A1]